MRKRPLLLLVLVLFAALAVSASAVFEAESLSAGPVKLDLCQGTITIEGTGDSTCYTQNGTAYYSSAGCIVRQSVTAEATANTIIAESGASQVTLLNLNIETNTAGASPIEIKSGASLQVTLLGENTLIAKNDAGPGIHVPEGASVVLDGTGSLHVEAYWYHAGIGSGKAEDAGDITINGGTITACASGAPGIGGGKYGRYGTVTITGGTVTATATSATAIGNGAKADPGGCGITITGGTVTATGDEAAHGIGAGKGTLLISDAVVYAYGGHDDKSCGSGLHGNEVHISNAQVTAVGGKMLYGSGSPGIDSTGSLTIEASTITAYSLEDHVAGIAGGCITLDASDVTVTSGQYYNTISILAKDAAGVAIHGGVVTAAGAIGGTADSVVAIRNGAKVSASAIRGSTERNQDSLSRIEISDAQVDLSDGCFEKIYVSEQPVSASGLAGHMVRFSVDASGYSGLTYQWQKSLDGVTWTDLEGQNAASAAVTLSEELDGAFFRCRLTNGWGNTVATDIVQAHILAFSAHPDSMEANVGDMAMLSAKSAQDDVTYHWERSYDAGATWVRIPDEIYSTLLITVQLNDNGALYRCVITTGNGDSLASDSARITVHSSATTYAVNYYQQTPDGTGYILIDRVVTPANAGTQVTAAERTYNFFSENPSLGIASGTVKSDNSLALSRYYDRNTYTLSIETDGGSASGAIVLRYGAAIVLPDQPRKLGYRFAGWYTDKTYQQKFTDTTMPGKDMTAFAKWELIGGGRGIAYAITGMTLRDADSQEISAIPAGRFSVEIRVENISSQLTDTLVLAAYDRNGRFLGLQSLHSDQPAGVSFTVTAELPNETGQIAKLRAFILPASGGLVPLAEAAEVPG